MVKSRLNKEIERGEQSQKLNPYIISHATFVREKVICFCLAHDGKRLTTA